MKSKTIWVVNYDDVNQFLDKAVNVGATAVAIRTDNDMVKAINAFHAKGIKVFGWRWPSAKTDPAMSEARKVVALLQKGLDGYYVDPERQPGKPYDLDQPGLDSLADAFCKTIVSSMHEAQVFRVTSHYRANKVFPKLPWAAFFNRSTVFLPQAYWRSDGGVIGHGEPEDNYDKSIAAWKAAGAPAERIVPMAGELTHSTTAEIAAYAAAANARGIESLHFYAYADSVETSVCNAIAQA